MTTEEIELFLQDFSTKTGEDYDLPTEGSLGLLALGDIGLIAWRLKQRKSDRRK